MTRPAPLSATLATYRAALELARQHAAQGTYPVDTGIPHGPSTAEEAHANRFDCAQCGGGVWADEDGCCTMCGGFCSAFVDGVCVVEGDPPDDDDGEAFAAFDAERMDQTSGFGGSGR